jgi:hypothetical protein
MHSIKYANYMVENVLLFFKPPCSGASMTAEGVGRIMDDRIVFL